MLVSPEVQEAAASVQRKLQPLLSPLQDIKGSELIKKGGS
jgi:hypothetical protein